MLQQNLLLAESGSTKTDWCLVRPDGRPVKLKTAGINPYLQSTDEIVRMLEEELHWDGAKWGPVDVVFYGAGIGHKEHQKAVQLALRKVTGAKKISVESDMLAAAHALAGHEKGVICIIGTGSNACCWDGRKIVEQMPSLGYVAGDEGSGNYMGKRVLQYYAYHTFDEELRASFEMMFGSDLVPILNSIYKEPFPNRYLAQFARLLTENRGHFMVENIIEDCLNDFFRNHILKFRMSWKQPIHFTGSIAWGFRDVIADLCHQYELEPGKIVQSPMESLIEYYKGAALAA